MPCSLHRRNFDQIPLKHSFSRNSNYDQPTRHFCIIHSSHSVAIESRTILDKERYTSSPVNGTEPWDGLLLFSSPDRIDGTIDGRRSRTGNKNENTASVSEGGSFPPDEDVLKEFLGDEPMRPGGTLGRSAVESAVDGVQLGTEFASDVEPPVADEHRLAELRAVWTEKRRLTAVYVAVVPRLAPCLDVREETRVRLVVAVEVRVRDFAQHWVIRACSTGYRFAEIEILANRGAEKSRGDDRCLVRRIVPFLHVLVVVILVVAVVLRVSVHWLRPL